MLNKALVVAALFLSLAQTKVEDGAHNFSGAQTPPPHERLHFTRYIPGRGNTPQPNQRSSLTADRAHTTVPAETTSSLAPRLGSYRRTLHQYTGGLLYPGLCTPTTRTHALPGYHTPLTNACTHHTRALTNPRTNSMQLRPRARRGCLQRTPTAATNSHSSQPI